MIKILRAVLCTLLLANVPLVLPSLADEAGGSSSSTIPQRERDLIDILEKARKQLTESHDISPAKDARMSMQINVMNFMRKGQEAQNWTGTVKSRGVTPGGDIWITIEIAENITISTWQTERDDRAFGTLLRQHSKQFQAAQFAKIGQPVSFSGTILKAILDKDDQMVLNPRYIARFSSLTVGN